MLDVLAPVLDKLIEGDKPKFNITKIDPLSVEFGTEDGFLYGFDSSRAFVEFQHRFKFRSVSGGPPVAELLSRPAPFTELLPEVARRLLFASECLLEIRPRKVTRVGVVSTPE